MTTRLARLMEKSVAQQFPKGQIVHVFEDAAMLNFIKKGYVKRYRITDDGHQSVQVVYGPGHIFPLTPVYKTLYDYDMYSGPEEYFYETITPVIAHALDQASLKNAILNDPQLFSDLFFAAGLRLNSYIHRLEGHAQKTASQSVAWQLAYLADTFGEKTANGVMIMLPLTHQNLADIVGLARETMTHSLKELRSKKLISSDKKHITVLDIEALQNYQ